MHSKQSEVAITIAEVSARDERVQPLTVSAQSTKLSVSILRMGKRKWVWFNPEINEKIEKNQYQKNHLNLASDKCFDHKSKRTIYRKRFL